MYILRHILRGEVEILARSIVNLQNIESNEGRGRVFELRKIFRGTQLSRVLETI